jgi:hypothetical protein
MPSSGLLPGLFVRHLLWVIVGGAVLGAAYGAALAIMVYRQPPPNAVLSTWPTLVAAVLSGALLLGVLGIVAGLLVGLVTGLVTACVTAAMPFPQRTERRYRWIMRLLGIGLGLFLGRWGTAFLAYWFIDFNWDWGWNREDFPTLDGFVWLAVVPTLLVGLGVWWATERAMSWYLRVASHATTTPEMPAPPPQPGDAQLSDLR